MLVLSRIASPMFSRLASSSISRMARTGVSRRFISEDVRSKIKQTVHEDPLVVFMKGTPESPECGFSRAVIQILGVQGVPKDKMRTYNVLEDPELRTSIKEFSEWPTIPQVYVGGEFVGGCDIVLSMHQSGELEALLEKHKIISAPS